MSTNPNDWLSVAEKIFNRAIGFGFVLLILSGAYWMAYRLEIVTATNTTTLVYSICQIVAVLSLALFILGVAIWVFRALFWLISWPFAAFGEQLKNRSDRNVLLHNYSLLRRESQIMFLHYVGQPNGRFRSPGNTDYIRELINLGLIRPEAPHPYVHNFSKHGELLEVVPLMRNAEIKKKITTYLVEAGFKVDDLTSFNNLLAHIARTGRIS